MNFTINALLSLSIGIAAIIGWVRFRKIDPAFVPFLWLIWLGLANEVISIMLMKSGFSNVIPYNLFNLCQAILITWQFRRWEFFTHAAPYFILQGCFILSWSIEV